MKATLEQPRRAPRVVPAPAPENAKRHRKPNLGTAPAPEGAYRSISVEPPPIPAVRNLPPNVRDALVAFIDLWDEGDFESCERLAHHLAGMAGRRQLVVDEAGVVTGGQG